LIACEILPAVALPAVSSGIFELGVFGLNCLSDPQFLSLKGFAYSDALLLGLVDVLQVVEGLGVEI
jgi:hypothetical protein